MALDHKYNVYTAHRVPLLCPEQAKKRKYIIGVCIFYKNIFSPLQQTVPDKRSGCKTEDDWREKKVKLQLPERGTVISWQWRESDKPRSPAPVRYMRGRGTEDLASFISRASFLKKNTLL